VAEAFKTLVQESKNTGTNGFFSILNKKEPEYTANNLRVFFHVFEPYAKAEANEKVTESKIKQLQSEINNEEIWAIVKAFNTAVFFFYTNEQVRRNEYDGMREKLSLKYFELVKQFDEFDYFKKDDFSINLDSKETFDKDYQGNWYYYFK